MRLTYSCLSRLIIFSACLKARHLKRLTVIWLIATLTGPTNQSSWLRITSCVTTKHAVWD